MRQVEFGGITYGRIIRLNNHLSNGHVDVGVTFNEILELLNDIGERFLLRFDLLGQILEPLIESLSA